MARRKKGKDNKEKKQRKGRTLTGQPATPVQIFPLSMTDTTQTPGNKRLSVEDGQIVFKGRKHYGKQILTEALDFTQSMTIDAASRTVVPFKRPGEEKAIDGFVLGNDSMINLKSNIPLPGQAAFGDHNQRQRRRLNKLYRFQED